MTTATATAPEFTYRAQTDKATKTWHLGAVEKDNVCFCGTRLLVAGDERKIAARIPADQRQYETSGDLSKVTCGACRRNHAWSQANAEAAGAAEAPPARRPRKSRAARTAAAKTAAEAATGSSVIETAPDGLPRIKPGVQARADAIVAAQKARNAEAGK